MKRISDSLVHPGTRMNNAYTFICRHRVNELGYYHVLPINTLNGLIYILEGELVLSYLKGDLNKNE